jgi:putative restriction endonuclease
VLAVDELALRDRIMHLLAQTFNENAVLTRQQLTSFDVGDGRSIRLIDESRGIWNPQAFESTLTIISDPDSEYDDGDLGDSLYRYAYQRVNTSDPTGGVNTKLRRAMKTGSPLVMLRKIGVGKFVPIMPVYVVADEPEHRRFILALDESLRFLPNPTHLSDNERRYANRVVKQRLHQPEFRARVISAYERRCAVCVLKKAPLLDAAHIIGDRDDDGLAVVPNGLSLCKIHHAAYDQNYLGISPDYVVRINTDLLAEKDGPMLKHGIQEMDGRPLAVPAAVALRPDRDRLALRFEAFENASA